MRSLPTVYLDSDETIQVSALLTVPVTGPEIVSVETEPGIFLAQYLRPGMRAVLADLRQRHRVVLFTAAVRSRARLNNESLKLGFDEADIIAREDFMATGYGGMPSPLNEMVDPEGILVDNQPPTHLWAATKRRFLGIGPDRYLQVPEFAPGEAEVVSEWETHGIHQRLLQLIERLSASDLRSRSRSAVPSSV